jgi:hypothetical protein
MYFRILEKVRPLFDPVERELALEQVVAAGESPGRLRRIGNRFRNGELTITDGLRMAVERATDRFRMLLPPAAVHALDGDRTAVVVAAAPNATGFPVLEALRDQFGWRVLFASWSRTVEPRVRALRLPYFHLADTYRRRYVSLQRRHETDVALAMARLDATELVSVFSEVAGMPVIVDLKSLMHEVCSGARVQTDLYFDFFARTSPTTLILFNEVTLRERPAARVAAQMGIKSVAIQHGLFIGHVYRSLATDKMIVWGRIPREFWTARGCTADEVISVGAFGHERWDGATEMAQETGSSRVGRPKVLFLGQNPAAFLAPRLHRASIDAVVGAAKCLRDVLFLVRPHPGESPEPYERSIRSSGLDNVVLRTDGDVAGELREAAVVLTIFSTAGLEAMLLGTPVVVLNPTTEPPLAPYASVVSTVDTAESLAVSIGRLLDVGHRANAVRVGRDYAQDYFGPTDGAARRAALEIDRFVSTDTRPANPMAVGLTMA